MSQTMVPLPPDHGRVRAFFQRHTDGIISHPVCAFFFALTAACCLGAWFSSGEMFMVAPILALGWIFAAVGWWWAPGLSKYAKIVCIIVSVLPLIAEGAILHWHFAPKTEAKTSVTGKSAISSQFEAISSQFERALIPQLGKPTGPIEQTTAIYQASHEHAMVVSLLPTLDVFVFPSDRSKKAIRQHAAAWKDDRKWFDESYLRSLFHPPKEKLPPENRVAELWAQNPDQWKWIGWREWSCPFVLDNFYYQKFEKGIIIGVLPTSETLGQSQIFAYADTGEWNSTISETVEAPACNEKTAKVNGVPIHGRFTR
jgi:hypothetical protein